MPPAPSTASGGTPTPTPGVTLTPAEVNVLEVLNGQPRVMHMLAGGVARYWASLLDREDVDGLFYYAADATSGRTRQAAGGGGGGGGGGGDGGGDCGGGGDGGGGGGEEAQVPPPPTLFDSHVLLRHMPVDH